MWGGVDNGEGYAFVGTGSKWEISASSSRFCCQPKTAPTSVRKYSRDFPGGPMVKTPPSNAGGTGSVPGRGAKILYGSWSKKGKQKQHCNKFNKKLLNGQHQRKSLKKIP